MKESKTFLAVLLGFVARLFGLKEAVDLVGATVTLI